MAQNQTVPIEMPVPVQSIKLPKGVDDRLQRLLDRQDRGEKLTAGERREAEGLIELAEFLTLLRLERVREHFEQEVLEESAELYAQVYSEDEDLRQLTELAMLEIVHD